MEPLPAFFGVPGAAVGFAGLFEALEGLARGTPYVEELAGAAHMAISVPSDVLFQLVHRIEAAPLYQALGKAQSHRSVVGPLSRFEAERATADHVVDGSKGARRHELEGGAEGVAHREP